MVDIVREVYKMNKKRILILTCSHGTGHKMVASTLSDALIKRGCETYIHDLFDEVNAPLNRLFGKAYLLSYGIGRGAYEKLYDRIDDKPNTKGISFFWDLTKKKMLELVNTIEPDAIINTYGYVISSMLKESHYPHIPVVSVVTDFCVPSPWAHPATDRYYVACDNVTDRLKELGVLDNRILETGIPIRDIFEETIDRNDVAQKYGLDPDKKTLLIFAGTYGVLKNLPQICKSIDEQTDLQTIVVCGKNKKLYDKLNRESFNNTRILGYVSEINELYRFCHLMITKPGGISLSEAATTAVPVILYRPTPGQEMENAKWFEKKNAAVIVNNEDQLMLAVKALNNNDIQKQRMKNNMSRIGHHHAASVIADDLLQLMNGQYHQNDTEQKIAEL